MNKNEPNLVVPNKLVPIQNHFEKIQPKDDLELKRSHSVSIPNCMWPINLWIYSTFSTYRSYFYNLFFNFIISIFSSLILNLIFYFAEKLHFNWLLSYNKYDALLYSLLYFYLFIFLVIIVIAFCLFIAVIFHILYL